MLGVIEFYRDCRRNLNEETEIDNLNLLLIELRDMLVDNEPYQELLTLITHIYVKLNVLKLAGSGTSEFNNVDSYYTFIVDCINTIFNVDVEVTINKYSLDIVLVRQGDLALKKAINNLNIKVNNETE